LIETYNYHLEQHKLGTISGIIMTTTQKSIMRFTSNGQLFGYKSDSQMLVWMKPSEFLDKTPKLKPEHDTSPKKTTVVDRLVDKMKKDKPIDPLFLDIDIVNCKVTNHEGRHRAIAAEKVGIARVPVIIYLRDDKSNFISTKEYLENGCKCNYFNAEKQK